MLYFTNSAGAVIGVLLAGFWLIEDLGLQRTMMLAGAGNLVVAVTAMRDRATATRDRAGRRAGRAAAGVLGARCSRSRS